MKKILMSFFVAALLSACGTAHVKTEAESADILNYTKIYISKVDVHSQEPAAKTNQKLQEKMLYLWSLILTWFMAAEQRAILVVLVPARDRWIPCLK